MTELIFFYVTAEIYFVIESAEIFQPFLRYFQSDEPLIHKLYTFLAELLVKILNRIGDQDQKKIVDLNCEIISSASFDVKNLRPIDEINLSEKVLRSLENCKEVDKAKFKLNVRQHFIAAGMHILQKTSYSNGIVKSLRYLSPSHILRPESGEEILKVARMLPFPISSTATDEWSLVKAFVQAEKLNKFKGRLDDFWNKIFDLKEVYESPKFPTVTKIVKCLMSLTHGSADIERDFSSSGKVLTPDKAKMSVRTLNARLNIKCGLKKFFQNSVVTVPIDKQFVNSARYAYQNYSAHMEKCREEEKQKEEQKELDEQKQIENKRIFEKITSGKSEIEKLEAILKEKIKSQPDNASKLLSEANERLKHAITKKNMSEITLAQAVIEGSKTLMETERNQILASLLLLFLESENASGFLIIFSHYFVTFLKKF